MIKIDGMISCQSMATNHAHVTASFCVSVSNFFIGDHGMYGDHVLMFVSHYRSTLSHVLSIQSVRNSISVAQQLQLVRNLCNMFFNFLWLAF